MSLEQWSIRLGADTIGPLTATELQALAANGSIQPDTPVSPDGHKWWNASQVRGLRFRDKALHAPSLPNTTPTANGSSIVWVVAGIGGFLLLLLLVGAVTLFPRPMPDEPTTTNAAESTYQYWSQVAQFVGTLDHEKATDATSAINQLRVTADSLEGLPTVGVDSDAVTCGLEIAKLLREIAAVSERGNNPSLLIEAFVRGAAGDPYGTSLEVMQSQRAVQERVQAVQQYAVQARAVLSARYGVEFPAL